MLYGLTPARIRPPHYGHHPPYAAVCIFPRQAGRPDNGNHLESGEIRGNMRVVLSDEKRKTLAPPVIFWIWFIVVSCNLWEFCAMAFDRMPYNPIFMTEK